MAKIVSPDALHKSELNGVVVGIGNDQELLKVFRRFNKMSGFAGMLVEEMVAGVELIVGAKIDAQFGPVILVGLGGVAVEVYKDTAIRIIEVRGNRIVVRKHEEDGE